jgi:hypothetical protein
VADLGSTGSSPYAAGIHVGYGLDVSCAGACETKPREAYV